MGCKTNGGYGWDVCSGSGPNLGHCRYYTAPAGQGVTLDFVEYPPAIIRSQSGYSLPDREDNRVMYPSIVAQYNSTAGGSSGAGAANCGKVIIADTCTSSFRGSNDTPIIAFDYTPNELSFDYGYSDTWFAYLYDTSNKAGHIGTACYYIETVNRGQTTTTPASGTLGDPDYDPGGSSTTNDAGTRCIPCTNFTCTPASTTISYTADRDLTGDADCPHPTLFGIGTNSKKIAFSYDAFSTQIPDGVVDFEVSYDGVTYTDIWEEGSSTVTVYESSQNPWGTGDENYSDFAVFDINDGSTAIDFRIKFRVEPIFDDTGANVVFSGTRWTLTEILNAGTGFTVNDVYPISTQVRLADNSLVNLTLNIKITEVGSIESTTENAEGDILRVGDTINGHTIIRAFHTEVGQFPYHVVYLDGTGADFVKDGQYTSSRDHQITVKAGYGIPDRAILIGMYEFLQKSIQFMTGSVNKDAPDTFNTLKLPRAFVSIGANGQITDVNVSAGAYKFDFQKFYDENSTANLQGYTSSDGVSTSGGSGSGLTVDIDVGTLLDNDGNEIADAITDVRINTCGSGYSVGDEITISGGSAKIKILEITSGGANLNTIKGGVELSLSAPSDNDTPIAKVSTDDQVPKFVLDTTKSQTIDLEIVTGDQNHPNIEPTSQTIGGDNVSAQIEANITGGSITSVDIVRPGRGYSTDKRPEIIITNLEEVFEDETGNDAYRDDLVPEFQGILGDLPEGELAPSKEDYEAIANSYNQVPKTRKTKGKNPQIQIKLDPDRERTSQRPQYKFSESATEPLKSTIVPDHDLSYLDNVDLPSDRKKVFIDDLARSKKTVNDNIDAITQKRIPEYTTNDESLVESCIGTFDNLPVASEYTKYIMRQYRPDPSKSTTIQVSLSCTPVNTGCQHFTCATPSLTPNSSSSSTDPETGVTSTTTLTYSMSTLLGPGCQSWTATGTMKIWHDLSKATRTVGLATQAQGNPFRD